MKATTMSSVKVKKTPVTEKVKKEAEPVTVKKEPVKQSPVKKTKPIIIDEVSTEKFEVKKFFEKRVVKGGVPIPLAADHVRVVIIKECEGMTGPYNVGDIIDLPDRRYKSMLFRGLVAEYKGDNGPNKER